MNAVAFGTTDTSMLRRDLTGMNRSEADEFLARAERASALGRLGRPAEEAAAVCLLVSGAASYVAGTTVVVDGGYLAVKSFRASSRRSTASSRLHGRYALPPADRAAARGGQARRALKDAGYGEDEIFEHTVAAAVAAELEPLEAGLRTLR